MRVLTIVHEEDAGLGVFDDALNGSGTHVETWRPTAAPRPPAPANCYSAIIALGGSQDPDQEERHPWIATEKRFMADALRARVPLLGVCLGAELLAEAEGTHTRRMPRSEIGWYDVELTAAGASDPVIGPIGQSFEALEWHSYEVVLPPPATALARGANCLQAFRVGTHAWGIQFHAEVTAADFRSWMDDYTAKGEIEQGVDPDAITRETEQRIDAWNEVGRGLCERFMLVASAR